MAQDVYQYNIVKSDEPITIDGVFKEKIWHRLDTISNFTRNFPVDSGFATEETRVRMFYTDEGIYVGVVCFGETVENSVIQSLKRDFKLENTDAFTVSIDPFGDRTNGFSFSLSPFNVQREGLLAGGGGWGAATSWDNKWYSATTICPEQYWVGEIFIPFKTLRYSNNVSTWRINFSRTNYAINEKSSWVPVPINFGLESLVFSGDLVWENSPPTAKSNVSLIPYVSAGLSGNYFGTNSENMVLNTGADAKIAVTPSLNLDVTINPDFSNVEIDDQILNLDRFSIALPEKRQFFLENSDLFNEFGFRRIRPFFSRNIGLKQASTGQAIQVPLLSGLRLSGKLNKDWRIGVMNVVEMDSSAYAYSHQVIGENENIQSSSYNLNTYNIGVIQRQLGSNSNIGGIFVNQLPMHDEEVVNSVAGVDVNYTSKNGMYKGRVFSHQSFTEGARQKAISQQANASFFIRSTKKLFLMWNHEYVGKNYNAANGFVPRKGIYRLEPMVDYSIFPKSELVQSYKMGMYWNYYTDLEFKRLDDFRRFNLTTKLLNTSTVELALARNYIGLNNEFDPTFKWDTAYAAGESFRNIFVAAAYTSDITKAFNFNISTDYGQYFEGNKFGLNFELIYRYQPYVLFSLVSNNNFVSLPGFEDAVLSRFGPKVEVTLSNKLFLNYYLQYNSTNNLFTNNIRLQWRFKPLSDLFLVYTDNYGATTEFDNQYVRFRVQEKLNRAIVLKLVYWLNL